MEPLVVRIFQMSWDQYATHPWNDLIVQWIIKLIGSLFILCGFLSLTAKKESRIQQRLILLGSGLLFFLAILYFKEKFYQWGELIEYALQFGSPLILVLILRKALSWRQLDLALRLLIVGTFLGHGLYAIGYYPVPGHFLDMTMAFFNLQNEQAMMLLKIAGVLDLVIVAGLLSGLRFYSLASYAALWGSVTALARVVCNVSLEPFIWSQLSSDLVQWLPEVLYRVCHGLGPVALILVWQAHNHQGTLLTLLKEKFSRSNGHQKAYLKPAEN